MQLPVDAQSSKSGGEWILFNLKCYYISYFKSYSGGVWFIPSEICQIWLYFCCQIMWKLGCLNFDVSCEKGRKKEKANSIIFPSAYSVLIMWLRFVDSQSSSNSKTNGSDKAGLSANATAYAPSHVSAKEDQKTTAPGEQSEAPVSSKASGETHSAQSRVRPGSSTSSGSENANAAPASSAPALSPSSSMGSLSSEKSSLNPYAKVWMVLEDAL